MLLIYRVRHNTVALTEHVEMQIQNRAHRAPGLISQLRAAVSNGGEVQIGYSSGSSGSKVPISTGAFDLLQTIETEVNSWFNEYAILPSLEHRIRSISGVVCNGSSIQQLHKWHDATERWIKQITELFDPPRKRFLDAPCPECKAKTAKLHHMGDNDDETINVPALQLFTDGTVGFLECKCLNCGAQWGQHQFSLLARQIGC